MAALAKGVMNSADIELAHIANEEPEQTTAIERKSSLHSELVSRTQWLVNASVLFEIGTLVVKVVATIVLGASLTDQYHETVPVQQCETRLIGVLLAAHSFNGWHSERCQPCSQLVATRDYPQSGTRPRMHGAYSLGCLWLWL